MFKYVHVNLHFPPPPLRSKALLAPAVMSVIFTYVNLLRNISWELIQFSGLVAPTAYLLALLFGLPVFMFLGRWVQRFFFRAALAGTIGTFIPFFLLRFPLVFTGWDQWLADLKNAAEASMFFGLYGLGGGVLAWFLSVSTSDIKNQIGLKLRS